jgi:hypothetical protein
VPLRFGEKWAGWEIGSLTVPAPKSNAAAELKKDVCSMPIDTAALHDGERGKQWLLLG